jgi:hypothetical protein
MFRSLGRMLWAAGWLFFTSMAQGAPPSAGQIQIWIRQLDSVEFAMREQAGRDLVSAGEAAVQPLCEVLLGFNRDAARRANVALEQIALSNGDATLTRVVAALQQASQRGKPGLAVVASELRIKHANLRRERAMAKIEMLGGQINFIVAPMPDHLGAGLGISNVAPAVVDGLANERGSAEIALPDPPPDLPPDEILPKREAALPAEGAGLVADAFVSPLLAPVDEQKAAHVLLTIDQQWRGGEEELAMLRDIPDLVSLRLRSAPFSDAALSHIAACKQLQSLEIDGTRFSYEAKNRFRLARPDVRILPAN